MPLRSVSSQKPNVSPTMISPAAAARRRSRAGTRPTRARNRSARVPVAAEVEIADEVVGHEGGKRPCVRRACRRRGGNVPVGPPPPRGPLLRRLRRRRLRRRCAAGAVPAPRRASCRASRSGIPLGSFRRRLCNPASRPVPRHDRPAARRAAPCHSSGHKPGRHQQAPRAQPGHQHLSEDSSFVACCSPFVLRFFGRSRPCDRLHYSICLRSTNTPSLRSAPPSRPPLGNAIGLSIVRYAYRPGVRKRRWRPWLAAAWRS